MKGVEQGCYASWRWMYYLTINNMTYDEIDEAVKNGKIKVGSKPPNRVISGLPDSAYSCGNPPIADQDAKNPAIPTPNKPKDGNEIHLTIPGCDGEDMMPVSDAT